MVTTGITIIIPSYLTCLTYSTRLGTKFRLNLSQVLRPLVVLDYVAPPAAMVKADIRSV